MHHTDPRETFAAIATALDGGTPLVIGTATTVPSDAALVLPTSGSTGRPRHVALSATAVRASATATAQRLGGPGHWVLTLPTNHVAGVQVLARAHLAGLGWTAGAQTVRFTAAGFAALAAKSEHAADGARRYVSLVPTQAYRIVQAADHGDPRALAALARFDAVLVGGAAPSPSLWERLTTAGVCAVETYGMTETCGGCVYNGVPLQGVSVRLAPDPSTLQDATGIVEISGPVLALGYAGVRDPAFHCAPDGTRWFRTRDIGSWIPARSDRHATASEQLRIIGRADDVVITGGANVSLAPVQAALAAQAMVAEAAVVGVPHPEWGQEIVAVLVPTSKVDTPDALRLAPTDFSARIRRAIADTLDREAIPRRIFVAPELPSRGPGKTDRHALGDLISAFDDHPT